MKTTLKKGRQLYDMLKEDIQSGKYSNGDKLPAIRVLSEEYGLSKNTVNSVYALLVKEGLATIRDGSGTYVGGTKHEPRMIGVMLMDFCQSFTVEQAILKHMQLNLPSNYYLGIVNASNSAEAFVNGVKRLHGMGAQGYIIVPPTNITNPHEIAEAITLLNAKPTITISRTLINVNADTYSMNLDRGIEKAMEYLSVSGKNKTAIVLHDTDKFLLEEMEAYIRCCRVLGITPKSEWLIDHTHDMSLLENKLKSILPDIDSIIAPDKICVNCMEILHNCGKKIPEELAVIGINDTMISRVFYPPLTSIVYPAERIGRHAITKLINRIEGMDTSPYKMSNYEPELIIRNT